MLILFLLIFGSCVERQVNASAFPTPNTNTSEEPKSVQRDSIGNTIGVIVLDKYEKEDFIHIFNEDGSLWYKFTYYYDESSGMFPYANDDFRPFAFHLDYFVLVLKCAGKEAGRYEVVVNEKTGLKKYVMANDLTMKFQTWEEHILQIYAIEFNQEENPLLESPQGKTKKVNLPKGEIERANLPIYPTFQPTKVKGDWLKVKWKIPKEKQVKGAKYDFGWIRWKKGERLLVELFYFC